MKKPNVEINELPYDVIEKRIYDPTGRLIEVRKEYPPSDVDNALIWNFPKQTGAKLDYDT